VETATAHSAIKASQPDAYGQVNQPREQRPSLPLVHCVFWTLVTLQNAVTRFLFGNRRFTRLSRPIGLHEQGSAAAVLSRTYKLEGALDESAQICLRVRDEVVDRVPRRVAIYPVPPDVGLTTTYSYAVINDRPVLIEPTTREVVRDPRIAAKSSVCIARDGPAAGPQPREGPHRGPSLVVSFLVTAMAVLAALAASFRRLLMVIREAALLALSATV